MHNIYYSPLSCLSSLILFHIHLTEVDLCSWKTLSYQQLTSKVNIKLCLSVLSCVVFVVEGLHDLQQLRLQQSICLRGDSVQISSCSMILQSKCQWPNGNNDHIAKRTKHTIRMKYTEVFVRINLPLLLMLWLEERSWWIFFLSWWSHGIVRLQRHCGKSQIYLFVRWVD